MLSECFDGCFTGVICSVSWRVGDALLASSDDDGAWFARSAGLERRYICVQSIDHAVEIGVKNLMIDDLEKA